MKSAIIILLLLAGPVFAQDVPCTTRLYPVDIKSIQYNGDSLMMDDYLAMSPGPVVEGRIVAEFDLSRLPLGTVGIYLVVEYYNYDPGGAVGQMLLHTYSGDGAITEAEFFAGTFHSITPANGDIDTLAIDVTTASFGMYAGIRLSCVNDTYEIDDLYLCLDDGTPIAATSWGKIKQMVR